MGYQNQTVALADPVSGVDSSAVKIQVSGWVIKTKLLHWPTLSRGLILLRVMRPPHTTADCNDYQYYN